MRDLNLPYQTMMLILPLLSHHAFLAVCTFDSSCILVGAVTVVQLPLETKQKLVNLGFEKGLLDCVLKGQDLILVIRALSFLSGYVLV